MKIVDFILFVGLVCKTICLASDKKFKLDNVMLDRISTLLIEWSQESSFETNKASTDIFFLPEIMTLYKTINMNMSELYQYTELALRSLIIKPQSF